MSRWTLASVALLAAGRAEEAPVGYAREVQPLRSPLFARHSRDGVGGTRP